MKTEFCYPLNFNCFAHKTHLVFLFFSLSLSLTDKNKLNFNINFNVFYFKSRFNIVNIFEARQKKKKSFIFNKGIKFTVFNICRYWVVIPTKGYFCSNLKISFLFDHLFNESLQFRLHTKGKIRSCLWMLKQRMKK